VPQTLQQRVIEALTPAPVWTKDDIILWRPFDAAPVVYYVRFLGVSACKVNVKGPLDAEPVQAMLREIAPADLPPPEGEPLIALAPSPALAGTPFALRAIVSPTLANGALAKTVQFMAPMTRTAFPAYRCEFPEGDTREELAFRLNKVVVWADWSREPAPAISARFSAAEERREEHRRQSAWACSPGGRSRRPSASWRRRTASWSCATSRAGRSASSTPMAASPLEAGGEPRSLADDALLPWVKVFVTRGLATAQAQG